MIGIIDYGVGNLKAFSNILNQLAISHEIVSDRERLKHSNKIILPGVGAFDSVIEKLEKSPLFHELEELVLVKKIPILGVCVGMQILANSSEEGVRSGLGWIDSVVKKFQFPITDKFTVPQIGWNNILIQKENPLLKDLEPNPHFYFLHSYYIDCKNESDVLARADYGGLFTCAVNRENIFGTQFHPEKSHHNGVNLIKNFTEL